MAELDHSSGKRHCNVRAKFNDDTITVYQAYSPIIAGAALDAQTFVPPFKHDRMTWIKPSFLWMMYRSGWATKPGQERILAIQIKRSGFEEALSLACLSHYQPDIHTSREVWQRCIRERPARVQWDPERDLMLNPLPWRTLQVGLSGSVLERYVDDWISTITDVTECAQHVHWTADRALLPDEQPYPLPDRIAGIIGANQ